MWLAYADGIVHRGLYAYTHGPYEFMIRIWSGLYAYGLIYMPEFVSRAV
jgi:hypothetical protein